MRAGSIGSPPRLARGAPSTCLCRGPAAGAPGETIRGYFGAGAHGESDAAAAQKAASVRACAPADPARAAGGLPRDILLSYGRGGEKKEDENVYCAGCSIYTPYPRVATRLRRVGGGV